jgi:hypothetical protein
MRSRRGDDLALIAGRTTQQARHGLHDQARFDEMEVVAAVG